MSENLVRAERTILQARDVYDALVGRWRATVATEPARQRVLVLLAHIWLETASGSASYGWNLAGIKWAPGCGFDHYAVETQEDDAKGTPTTIVAQFRSYAGLAEAVADYMGLLRGRFGFAWPAVEGADPRDFAHRLRARGYYTAPEQQYADAMAIRYQQVLGLISEDTVPDTPTAIRNGRPAYVPPSDRPDPPDPVDDG